MPAKTITLSCDICNETYTDSDIYIIHVWSHCPYDVEVLLKNCNKDKTIEDSKKNIELSSTIICKKDVVKENTISGDSIESESVKNKIDKDGIKNEFDGVTDKDDTAEHISSKSSKNSFVIKEVHGDKNKSVNNKNCDKSSYQYARVIVENVHKNITRIKDQTDSSKHSEDGLDENNVMDNTTKLVEIEESDSNDDFGDNCFDVETQKDDNINESNEKSPEIGHSETASIDPQSSLDWNKAFLNYVQTSEVVDSDGESIEEANDDTINDEIEDSEDDIEAAIKPMKIIPVKNIEKENQNGKKDVNEIVEKDDHLKTYTENSTAFNNAIDKENPEEKVKNQVDIPESDKVIVPATEDERQMHNHKTSDKAKENNDIKYGFDKKVNVLQVNAKDVTNKDKFACKTVKVMLKRYSLDALNMMADIMNKRNNTEEKNIGYEMEVKTTFDNIDLNYDCEIVSDNQNAPPEEVKEVEVSSVHHVANSAENSCNELEETGEFIEVSYRTSVRNLEEIKDNESFIENNVVNEDNTVKDIIDEESSKENNYGKPTAHPFNQDNAKNIEKNMKYSDEMNKEEIVDEKESIFDDQDSENMEIKENTEVKSCEDKNANFPVTVEPNHLSDNSPEICNGKEFLQEAHEAPNAVDVKKNDTEKEIVAENADIINDGDHKIMELDKSNGNEDTSFDEDLDEELFDILEPVPENDQGMFIFSAK